jgi:hypothetical protein
MKNTIFLASSMDFYKELVEIEKQLELKGFKVDIPYSAQTMKKNNDFEVAHFKGVFTHKQKGGFIHSNFDKIAKSDSLLVINNDKKGIKGYIGTNVLMEIAIAFYFKKNIYILNPIEDNASFTEELFAFGVKFINGDLDNVS